MTGIRLVRLNSTVLLWVKGVLDDAQRPDLRRALEESLASGAVVVVIDLVAVSGVDDDTVTLIAAAATLIGRRGGRIHLLLPGSYRATVVEAEATRRVLNRLFPQPGEASSAA
jgi:anti-anti-sigma regulatory factor